MSVPDCDPVGIFSASMYLPAQILLAEKITEQSGLEEWVICEKIGILENRMAAPDDNPDQIAVWVAQDCLSKCDNTPKDMGVPSLLALPPGAKRGKEVVKNKRHKEG